MNNNIIKIIVVIFLLGLIGFFFGIPYSNNLDIDDKIAQINSFEKKQNVSSSFESEDFSKLPTIVKNYLLKAIKNKTWSPKVSLINYSGKFKTSPNAEWVDINSTINISTIVPAFVQVSETYENNPIWNKAIDTYINSSASTSTELLSSITLNNFEGNKLNRSFLVLYLMESIFSPTSLLPNINAQWRSVGSNSAEATIWDKNVEGSAVFYFNENNEVVKITSDNRFMPGKNDYSKENFTMYLANYKEINNYYIPTYFEFQWNLASGDFTFGRFQITNISYK